jgi:hypothetical protein
MRLLRITTVVMLAAAASLAIVSPAQAGGWATTLLDPLPDRLEPGRAYTVGYWVLQHGSHPYEGDLGKTALRLTDEAGSTTTYAGMPLAQAGHYATAVVFAHPGRWTLSSVQGIFADYEIGSATVPGGLRVLPTPTPMIFDHGDAGHWGAIQPPLAGLPMPADAVHGSGMPAASSTANPAPAAVAVTEPQDGRSVRSGPVVTAVALTAVGLLLAGWRRSRTARRRSGPPSPIA